MITNTGEVLCETCLKLSSVQNPRRITMARLEGKKVKLWGKHDGQWHERIITIEDLLPAPDTQEFIDLVADLLRRLAVQIKEESLPLSMMGGA